VSAAIQKAPGIRVFQDGQFKTVVTPKKGTAA